MTHVDVNDHVGVSEQCLGALPGGGDIVGPVQQPLPKPAAVRAPPYRPMYVL